MIQLNRSMMERYEIPDRRPATLRAALFGANRITLGVAARLFDRANELGGDIGAVCFAPAAKALRAQDGMFTLLVRGEAEDGAAIREERVVQSVLAAVDPESEFDAFLEFARRPELELCALSTEASPVELALLARFLHARWSAKLPAPCVLLLGDDPLPGTAEQLREAVAAISRDWTGGAEFAGWLSGARFSAALVESLCGPLRPAERERAQREMNYRDDFLAWAEPQLRCVVDGGAPTLLASVCDADDFATACARKLRIFDSLVFLCAPLGFLCGMDSFAQALRDEALRGFIAHAFYDELLPELPWPREELAPCVISAFSRLENPMNDVPLLELGQNLLSKLPRTLLPAIRSHASREFDAPPKLALALAAAFLLYAGAREDDDGAYRVYRDELDGVGDDRQNSGTNNIRRDSDVDGPEDGTGASQAKRDGAQKDGGAHQAQRGAPDSADQVHPAASYILRDDEAILRTFARFSPDMPPESLAYAALADREIWGEDLREIDGLESRISAGVAACLRLLDRKDEILAK